MPLDTRLDAVTEWLLAGDVSIRWQVEQDLRHAPARDVEQLRARVATEGWGRRLLDEQDGDGRWAGALYSPKWTSTTYTLLLLHRLGLPAGHPQARAGCRALWAGAQRRDGGLVIARSPHTPEICVTGMLVLLAVSFGHEEPGVDAAVRWLVGQQLADGGWNCRTVRTGSTHGSFHTSITVLEALLAYESAGGTVPVATTMARGRAFFLDHQLYRSHRTGAVADPAFERFPFPPQWHFDVLRGLEHFRAAGAPRDERLASAVDAVRRRRRPDGTWARHRPYAGRAWFALEPAGPSRWSTLRALRILDWWEASPGGSPPATSVR